MIFRWRSREERAYTWPHFLSALLAFSAGLASAVLASCNTSVTYEAAHDGAGQASVEIVTAHVVGGLKAPRWRIDTVRGRTVPMEADHMVDEQRIGIAK